MSRFLGLSEEQKAKMTEVRKRHFEQTKAVREELFQKRRELGSVYTDPKSNEAAIIAKQTEINKLRQKLLDDTIQLKLEQRRLLTPEQLQKLADLKSRFEGCARGRRLG
jgi:Spy/CpxP family protein refolding chaperone